MTVIDIILYYGGPLSNANANEGLSFEGPGIKCYYTQIDLRLKTLNDLKMIVMEELRENSALHNIQIIFRSPHEVFKDRINYKYMEIEADKHVKIMFDKMERIAQVSAIELYIKLELRAEVGTEEIQQTTTSLQVTVPDAQYDCGETDADNAISVQNIMNTIPVYTLPALPFSVNTRANMERRTIVQALWFAACWGFRLEEVQSAQPCDIIKLVLEPPKTICQAHDLWMVSLKMALTLEEIWCIRNAVIHQKGPIDLLASIGRIGEKFKECTRVFSYPQTSIMVQPVIRWSPPPPEFIKLNVDAAIAQNTSALAVVTRNE